MLRVTVMRIGECRAPARGAGQPGLIARFPALAFLIEADGKALLVDSGYGPAFFAATRGFPARLYRWTTPVRLPAGQHLLRQVPRLPDAVFVTHFHADHAAGLIDLPPGIPVLASQAAIDGLALGDMASLRAACPPGLRDALRARDPRPVDGDMPVATGLAEFPLGHDLLGDGRLIAIPLPGHGIGQTGVWLPELARFLIADAAYSRAALRSGRMPPRMVLARLGDADAYARTFAALRALMARRPEIRFDPSHCPEVA